jgi:hypothetical protein
MPQSKRRNVARTAQPRQHMNKQMLLPMRAATATEVSLANHLALAVIRSQHGARHQFNELMKVVYMAHYLQEAGFGSEPRNTFVAAESGVRKARARGKAENIWIADDATTSALARIVSLYDWQILCAPVWTVLHAEDQLMRLINDDGVSPLWENAADNGTTDDVDLKLNR